jgi:dTDP-4-dehydrorhamnose reductase
MKLLVLGGSGFLGSSIVNYALKNKMDIDVFSTYFSATPSKFLKNKIKFNFKNKNDLELLIANVKPDLIINAIALANVDHCQQDKKQAFHLNVRLPSILAKICNRMNVKLAHISTDHIFNGTSKIPYAEESTPDPQNYYAESKLLGEYEVIENCENAIIARTNFFGNKNDPNSFVTKVLNATQEEPFGLFNDVYFSPLSSSEVAECIFKLIEINYQGVINVTSGDSVSKFEFGKLVLIAMNASVSGIFERSIEDMADLVIRPKMLSLSNKKLVRLLGESYNFDIKKSISTVL